MEKGSSGNVTDAAPGVGLQRQELAVLCGVGQFCASFPGAPMPRLIFDNTSGSATDYCNSK